MGFLRWLFTKKDKKVEAQKYTDKDVPEYEPQVEPIPENEDYTKMHDAEISLERNCGYFGCNKKCGEKEFCNETCDRKDELLSLIQQDATPDQLYNLIDFLVANNYQGDKNVNKTRTN